MAQAMGPLFPLLCRNCGYGYARLSWQVMLNGAGHARADCAGCGQYVKYVPQTPEVCKLLGPRPQPGPAPQMELFR